MLEPGAELTLVAELEACQRRELGGWEADGEVEEGLDVGEVHRRVDGAAPIAGVQPEHHPQPRGLAEGQQLPPAGAGEAAVGRKASLRAGVAGGSRVVRRRNAAGLGDVPGATTVVSIIASFAQDRGRDAAASARRVAAMHNNRPSRGQRHAGGV